MKIHRGCEHWQTASFQFFYRDIVLHACEKFFRILERFHSSGSNATAVCSNQGSSDGVWQVSWLEMHRSRGKLINLGHVNSSPDNNTDVIGSKKMTGNQPGYITYMWTSFVENVTCITLHNQFALLSFFCTKFITTHGCGFTHERFVSRNCAAAFSLIRCTLKPVKETTKGQIFISYYWIVFNPWNVHWTLMVLKYRC